MSTGTFAFPALLSTAAFSSDESGVEPVFQHDSASRRPSPSRRATSSSFQTSPTLSTPTERLPEKRSHTLHQEDFFGKIDDVSARRPHDYTDALGISAGHSKDSRARSGSTMWPTSNGRSRGQSDLGRRIVTPLQTKNFVFPMSPLSPLSPRMSLPPKLTSFIDESVNGLSLALSFLLVSFAFPRPHFATAHHVTQERQFLIRQRLGVLQSLALAALALTTIGILSKVTASGAGLGKGPRSRSQRNSLTVPAIGHESLSGTLKGSAQRVLALALPYYSTLQLGGLQTAFVLLVAIATGIVLGFESVNPRLSLKDRLQAQKTVISLMLTPLIADLAGLTGPTTVLDVVLGYLALYTSALVLPPPIPGLDRFLGRSIRIASTPASAISSAVPTPPATPRRTGKKRAATITQTYTSQATIDLVTGTLLAGFVASISRFLKVRLISSPMQVILLIASLVFSAHLLLFAKPIFFPSSGRPGVATGHLTIIVSSFIEFYDLRNSRLLPFAIIGLCGTGYIMSLIASSPDFSHFRETRWPDGKKHEHSFVTDYLLSFCVPGSMLDTILSERDSRRIAYFGFLNLAFMLVQFFYGFVTGSLGLLTDSIHMLFDCLGLAVGLAAAVMSKWPPSLAYPYGYGKIETLSGFANGIFLILVSIEIIFDATHRLHDGRELRRLNELLIVSILGFLVNIVGLTAFGHAHHGHGHDHSHSSQPSDNTHDHQRSAPRTNGTHEDHKDNPHLEDKPHDHSHSHELPNGHQHHGHGHTDIPTASAPPTPFSLPSLPPPTPAIKAASEHTHSHENENMQGIFLHILADALGSVSVIVSTLLTKYDGWSGWDPLASVAIAVLIFLSAVPLVRSSGSKLLLGLPANIEYETRDTLQGIGELRGVVGYGGVRLWLKDRFGEAAGHHHHHHHHHHHDDHGTEKHNHDHDHSHDCDDHDPSHEHKATSGKLIGVIHVVAASNADREDVHDRVDQYLKDRSLDLTIHVEIEGREDCWCRSQ